jgi:hypothetical protein
LFDFPEQPTNNSKLIAINRETLTSIIIVRLPPRFSLTLYGWFPRTALLPLLLSVNHFHVSELTLVAAVAYGN